MATNIWGASQLANPFNQIINLMSMDMQMKMQAESKVRQILEDADPVKFMSIVNQEEQTRRSDVIQQEIVDLAKERDGRFNTQDMMDINFMVNEFDTWQNNTLATQEAFSQEYKTLMGSADKYDMEKGMGVVQLYLEEPESYRPGHMLAPNPYNPMEYYSKLKIRTEPIHSTPPDIQLIDGVYYAVREHTWTTPEEREARVFSDYMTNGNLKAGMHKLWDKGVGGNEQLLWQDKMYESNKDPHIETKMDNPTLFQSMKTYGAMIQPNTTSYDRMPMSYDPKKPEIDITKYPHLISEGDGELQNLVVDYTVGGEEVEEGYFIGGKLKSVDYGDYEKFYVEKFKTGKDLIFDDKTFILNGGKNISWYGKPAHRARFVDKYGQAAQQSMRGKFGKVQELYVYKDMPVYIGEETYTFPYIVDTKERAWAGRKLGREPKVIKENINIYNGQPLPPSFLDAIEAERGADEYGAWEKKNIRYMPLAVMPVEGHGGITVAKVFDEELAQFMGVVNPELALKQELPRPVKKEPKPGRESSGITSSETVYIDALGNEFTQEEKGFTNKDIQDLLGSNKIRKK